MAADPLEPACVVSAQSCDGTGVGVRVAVGRGCWMLYIVYDFAIFLFRVKSPVFQYWALVKELFVFVAGFK